VRVASRIALLEGSSTNGHGSAVIVQFDETVDENLNNMNTKQRGITGLETAIILIAFVVVASVFAFTVLSTGIFSSERAKETIFAGLEQTKNTLRPSGSVIAFKGYVGSTEAIFKISMIVESVDGSDPIDLTPPYTADGSGTDPDSSVSTNRLSIVYIDDNQILQDVPWSADFIGDNGDTMLDDGEKVEIVIWLLNRTTATDITSNSSVNYMSSGGLTASGTLLTPNDQFTVELQPPSGAVLTVRRTLPAALDTVINLR
jgi:archaeal flagellin FlaB